MEFWLKISICQSGMVQEGCWVNFLTSWKLQSIDSLLKRIRKTGTIVRQPRSGRPHYVHSSGTPCSVRRTSQKGTDQLV